MCQKQDPKPRPPSRTWWLAARFDAIGPRARLREPSLLPWPRSQADAWAVSTVTAGR
jgi:hypothetical protein